MNLSDAPYWIQQLEQRAGGKPVVLVEGNTDVPILAYFLEKIEPGWDTKIEILPVKEKHRVITAIKKYHPEWVDIVDRDEWSPEYVVKTSDELPRLKVLPRLCLENYFCIPDELWAALPPNWKHSLHDDVENLKQPIILDALPDWVAQGAMWRVIRNRHTALLYESKFPTEFDSQPITNEDDIRKILQAWHDQLHPKQIIHEYKVELDKALKKEQTELLARYIHGKKFFRQVIVPTLNTLLGQAKHHTWLERFSQEPFGLPVPYDLRDFLVAALQLF